VAFIVGTTPLVLAACATLSLTLAAGCGERAEAKRTAFEGRIVFHSDHEGPFDLYVLDGASGELTRLTTTAPGAVGGDGELASWFARWSPDGSHLTYVKGPLAWNGMGSAYVVRDDGLDSQRLEVPGAPVVLYPSFSPDGRRIALLGTRDEPTPTLRLFVGRAHGTSWTTATWRQVSPEGVSGVLGGPQLAWAADGASITYTCRKDGEVERVCRVSLATGEVELVSRQTGIAGVSGWSPKDGRLLGSGDPSGAVELRHLGIFVMNARRPPRWLELAGESAMATWSPDGSRIAYQSTRDGKTDLYLATPTGDDEQRILDLVGKQAAPDWTRSG
jgi:TolB protein